MRISDWSSDVCSSDLRDEPFKQGKPNDILDRGAAGPRPRRLSRRRKNESAPRRRRADAAATGRVRQLSLPAVRAQGLSDRQGEAISGADLPPRLGRARRRCRSEEHTSELQSLMRISYAVFCLKKTTKH